jgi:hypothetical protein
MSIEQLEKILIKEFRCDKLTANLTANLIADFDEKLEDNKDFWKGKPTY